FFQHLAAVGWTALGIGLLFHLLRLLARIPAWRNILRAAYPQARVPRRGVTGAYLAGVGVNSILPARSGDLLRLYLVKRRIQGSAILARPRRFFTGVVTWQAASWVFRYATVYAFLRAFHVPATAHNALLVLVVQSLATLFPFTPGGVGTQQGLLVYVFRGESI